MKNFPIAPVGMHWQIDFKGFQKRLCGKWTCKKWHAYRPTKFFCTVIERQATCFNTTVDLKRACDQMDTGGWDCKVYYYDQEKQESMDVAYTAKMYDPRDNYPNFN